MKSLIVLFTLTFGLIMVGCSNNQADDKTSKTEKTQKTSMGDKQMGADKAYYDSLAAIQYPVRDKKNPIVTISTDYGNMTLELWRDVAPAHVDSFVARTKEGFYDSLTFHRVIDNFMIQGGDPKGNGTGNAGYFLPAEFSKEPHVEGTLSMARGQNPNSASCQFFICLNRAQFLDGKYTVFGKLLKGYDTLHKIGKVKCIPSPGGRGEVSTPEKPVYMTKVYLSDADGNPIK